MPNLVFRWDSKKDSLNQEKHGVSFEEAKSVFYDERARLINDPDHSELEERFILLGFSSALRLLVVCHCYREDESTIRIISARKATKFETKNYPRQPWDRNTIFQSQQKTLTLKTWKSRSRFGLMRIPSLISKACRKRRGLLIRILSICIWRTALCPTANCLLSGSEEIIFLFGDILFSFLPSRLYVIFYFLHSPL